MNYIYASTMNEHVWVRISLASAHKAGQLSSTTFFPTLKTNPSWRKNNNNKLIPKLDNPSVVFSPSGCRWHACERIIRPTPYNRM